MIKLKHNSAPATRAQQHRTQPATVNHGYGLKGIYTEGHFFDTEKIIWKPNWIVWAK